VESVVPLHTPSPFELFLTKIAPSVPEQTETHKGKMVGERGASELRVWSLGEEKEGRLDRREEKCEMIQTTSFG
jgi:hypothetical protein